MGRRCRQVGDEPIEFLDGLPPPTEQELADSHDAALAAWNHEQNPPKRWPSVEEFISEFTMPEMAAIGLSQEPTIAAFRFLLSGWRSEVHSDDIRVIQGLTVLVDLAIITEERKTQILA
jgi:hypothetical protein